MGKKVTAYQVSSFTKVDVTRYNEGDLFMTKRAAGILQNGRIKTLSTSTPNLKDYVKKSEIESLIQKYMKEGDSNE